MCSLASTGKSLFTVENMCGMSICGQPSCRLQCSYAVFNSLWPPTATSFKVTENTHPVLLVPSTPMEMVPQFLWDLMNLYVPSPYGERKVGAWYCRAPQNNRQPHSESYSETKSINTHLKEKHVSILVLGSSRLVVIQPGRS